jgi:putative sigma-54 modulation protein
MRIAKSGPSGPLSFCARDFQPIGRPRSGDTRPEPFTFAVGLPRLHSRGVRGIVDRIRFNPFIGPAVVPPGFHPECTRRLYMNLTISGHHLSITPALKNYVTTKLDRITRHFDQVVDIKVLLTVEKQKEKERRQRAECRIHVKGNDMFAESSHEDLYAALDELVDKLDRQVGRHKTRLQDHHHPAAKRIM